MFVTSDAIQVNLQPETDIERRYMDMLSKAEGSVKMSQFHDIGRCQGGYIRDFGDGQPGLAITITKAVTP